MSVSKYQKYIDNSLKPPKKFFDWCYSQIHTFKWSNKNETILASDRKNCEVIEKQLRKNTVLTFNDKFYAFALVLVTKKRIEIQTWTFYSEIIDGKQIIEKELANLELFTNDKHIKVGKWWNGYSSGLVPMYPMGHAYTRVEFFEESWDKRISEISELKYIDFTNDEECNEWFCLSRLYKYKKEIEFLQKIGAKKIASELMRGHSIDMRTFSENWLKRNKSVLKNTEKSFSYFELENRIKSRGGKIVPGIEKYLKFSDINHIPKKARMINFQNWIIKNEVDFSYYKDYLMLLDEMEVAVDTDNLITPKDLTKAHDNAVELFNIMTAEGKTKSSKKERMLYEKRIKQMDKLEAVVDGYAFITPKSTKEIINEGKQLSHCVGGSQYVDGHFKGTTTIVFVRKKDSINKPFYTIEYQGGNIKQIRGKRNQLPPDEVKKAANHWLKKIKTKKKKKVA